MDPQRILKALSNPHRLDIILWLKHPEQTLNANAVWKIDESFKVYLNTEFLLWVL